MKRAVLADTGPLYAAADSSDQYHVRAQEELARLEREGLTIVVAHSTLLETYTLVLRRLGIGAAHHWLREVLAGNVLVNPTRCWPSSVSGSLFPSGRTTTTST